MPQISLNWDLIIVVFFAIVMSYVFIIGKEQSMKLIIAAFVSIIAVQGMGYIASHILLISGMTLETIGLPVDVTMMSLGKIFLFALCMILFMLRSGVDISYETNEGSILKMVYTGLFGFAASGLIASTLLTYALGSAVLTPIASSSVLLDVLIQNRELWFTVPALLIIALGLLHHE